MSTLWTSCDLNVARMIRSPCLNVRMPIQLYDSWPMRSSQVFPLSKCRMLTSFAAIHAGIILAR
jgi:hypothetical protein